MENDLTFLTRRLAEERLAAERADNPKAKAAHLELASLFQARLDVLQSQREKLHIVSEA